MPFQSEKQRRYLWANEPEIARDWTDTYGSGIAKALGGRVPLANGNFLTGQHFGEEGNRQQLINAMEAGLINERDYKLMSGYDASQEILGLGGPNWNPLKAPANFAASGIYNLGKTVMSPEDYFTEEGEKLIGPIDSTLLNTMGSMGYGFNKDQYEGILGLDPEAFNTSETGPYGSNYSAQLAQRSGLAPAYDFDEPSGEIMKVPTDGNYVSRNTNYSEMPLDTSRFKGVYAGPGQGDEAENYREQAPKKSNLFWEGIKKIGRFVTPGGDFNFAGFLPRGGMDPAHAANLQYAVDDVGFGTGSQRDQFGMLVGQSFADPTRTYEDRLAEQKEKLDNFFALGKKNSTYKKQLDHINQVLKIKEQEKAAADGGKDGQTPKTPTKTVHSGKPTGGHHQGGGGGIGSTASKQGAAPGQKGASSDWRAKGGRIGYLQGGLAALWPR